MEALKNLAFTCAREFHKLPPKEKECSIIVKGRSLTQIGFFMNYLRPLVDVLVCDEQQFPHHAGQYVFDLNQHI